MKLKTKLRNFLIFLTLTSFTLVAHAQGTGVVKVEQGSTVPFAGWCLTEPAMAKIIADKEQEEQRCQLRLGEQKEKLEAKFNLEIGDLKLRVESLEKELKDTITIKDQEIEKLEKIALDNPNNYWYLFTAGGFVIGVGTTVGIVYILGL